MSTNGLMKLLMAKNSQNQNQKQKKARARKVNNEEKKNYSKEMEEVNPLLQQIEMLKTKAMEWQEELKNQDETGKLTDQIAQLEEISRRLENQIKRLDAADGRVAEQTHQIGKKIAYQMGQISDRFDELERELSRDLNESFAEMLEKVDGDTDSIEAGVSEAKLEQIKGEIIEKLDKLDRGFQNQTTLATSEKIDQLKTDIFGRMDRELLNKAVPVTEQKLEAVKAELDAKIDSILTAVQSTDDSQKLEDIKQEILHRIEELEKEKDDAGSEDKLDTLKSEIFEHVHKECVKQYRNIQLLFDEISVGKENGGDAGDLQKQLKEIGKYVKIATVVGVLTFGSVIAFILVQLDVLNGLI